MEIVPIGDVSSASSPRIRSGMESTTVPNLILTRLVSSPNRQRRAGRSGRPKMPWPGHSAQQPRWMPGPVGRPGRVDASRGSTPWSRTTAQRQVQTVYKNLLRDCTGAAHTSSPVKHSIASAHRALVGSACDPTIVARRGRPRGLDPGRTGHDPLMRAALAFLGLGRSFTPRLHAPRADAAASLNGRKSSALKYPN